MRTSRTRPIAAPTVTSTLEQRVRYSPTPWPRLETTVAWDDTRLANAVTEGQDVFVRAAQFEAFGADSSTAVPYAIAATGGLALAGLVLLLFGRRRRAGSPVLPPTDRAESLSAS